MQFITVTPVRDSDGSPYRLVVVSKIQAIVPMSVEILEYSKKTKCTQLICDNSSVYVRETPEEIMAMIGEATSKCCGKRGNPGDE